MTQMTTCDSLVPYHVTQMTTCDWSNTCHVTQMTTCDWLQVMEDYRDAFKVVSIIVGDVTLDQGRQYAKVCSL